jgi:hypothetical protein
MPVGVENLTIYTRPSGLREYRSGNISVEKE